ncbi:sulfatase-like hydrolase/transferase [Candidatus Pacearchaeota archaeon]|nr:sulfatase-like hydrolase/transferase [Candidatus Pacearchaeota archaeon]
MKRVGNILKRKLGLNTFYFSIVAFIFSLPLLLYAILFRDSLLTSFFFVVSLALFYLIQIMLVAWLNNGKKSIFLKKFFIITFSTIYFLCYVGVALNLFNGGDFSYMVVFFTGLKSVFIASIKFNGLFIVTLIALGILFIIYIIFRILKKTLWEIDINHKNYALYLVVPLFFLFLAILFVQGAADSGFMNYVRKTYERYDIDNNYFKQLYDDSNYQTDSDMNVIVLQLESVNSFGVLGNFSVEREYYNSSFTPNLWKYASRGIFFPKYIGNSVRTIRAQANMFCGVFLNMNRAFAFRLDELNKDCLPVQLRKSGYRSLFFREDTLEFTNFENFIETVGFDEIHQSDIMQEDDAKADWGYYDEIFFERVFDYLNNNYKNPDQIFTYIEISAHHFPFESYEDDKKFDPPIKNAEEVYEHYLNSLAWQDYYLDIFMKLFDEYSDNNTLLIITGDHSYPIFEEPDQYNTLGLYDDNILIPVLFIPPKNVEHEYKVGSVNLRRHSQLDFRATLFSLLNNQTLPNSFIFNLKDGFEEEDYEDCAMAVQPFGELKVGSIKNNIKSVYSLEDKSVTTYDLTSDPLEVSPILFEEGITYEKFFEKHLCSRYKQYINKNYVSKKPYWYLRLIFVVLLFFVLFYIFLILLWIFEVIKSKGIVPKLLKK